MHDMMEILQSLVIHDMVALLGRLLYVAIVKQSYPVRDILKQLESRFYGNVNENSERIYRKILEINTDCLS